MFDSKLLKFEFSEAKKIIKIFWTPVSAIRTAGHEDISLFGGSRKNQFLNVSREFIFIQTQSSISCLRSLYLHSFACRVTFHQVLLAAKSFIPAAAAAQMLPVTISQAWPKLHTCTTTNPSDFYSTSTTSANVNKLRYKLLKK